MKIAYLRRPFKARRPRVSGGALTGVSRSGVINAPSLLLGKQQKTKERFIELRAEGHAFDRIAQELDVSKPTLIQWHKEFEREIADPKFLRLESLIDQYRLMKERRVEAMGQLLNRVSEELESRELSELPVKQLLELHTSLQAGLNAELREVRYRTGERRIPWRR